METKRASKNAWKHIICCLVLLIIFVLTIGIHINAEGNSDNVVAESTSDTVPLRSEVEGIVTELTFAEKNEVELAGPKEEVTVEVTNFDYYTTIYADKIEFYSRVFGVDPSDIWEDIKTKFADTEFGNAKLEIVLNKENEDTFIDMEYKLVEYFYNYVESNPRKVNKKRVPYKGDASYIENLIIYYTTHVYTNVDTVTALSIGAAESGYYKVKYMLKCNNVYGGMTSSGLKKHKNIEYGVLSYIRMLSRNYYGKGLNTIAKIGRKYCPVYDSFGNKIASPHWIKLVNTAITKYKNFNRNIEVTDLQNNKGNA